jgi:hypothetical protein
VDVDAGCEGTSTDSSGTKVTVSAITWRAAQLVPGTRRAVGGRPQELTSCDVALHQSSRVGLISVWVSTGGLDSGRGSVQGGRMAECDAGMWVGRLLDEAAALACERHALPSQGPCSQTQPAHRSLPKLDAVLAESTYTASATQSASESPATSQRWSPPFRAQATCTLPLPSC